MNTKTFAKTMEGWNAWHAKAKAEQPVRYFCTETIPLKWRRFVHRLSDAKWWVLHRIHPRHRYHIVKTGLSPGYHDKDTLILHACFSLMKRYVEGERGGIAEVCKYFEWCLDDGKDTVSIDHCRELIALYEWWEQRRKVIDDFNDAQYSQDQTMLRRLIDIRASLWT